MSMNLGLDDDLEGDLDGDLDGDDDLGDDLGDDLFIGGPRSRAPLKSTSLARRVHNARLQKSARVLQRKNALMQKAMQHVQPSEQTQVLPFPRGEAGGANVPAATTATVFARPQRPFQTQRFVWASTTSPFFAINQLTIGQENMFVQAGVVPAEVFSQTGVHVALSGYIAYPGIDITLQVQNTDVAAHPIEASIIGAALV